MKKLLKIFKWTMISLLMVILVGFISSEITIAILKDQATETPLNTYQSVDVDGQDIAYRTLVPEGDSTLVIVHGFLGNSYEYINMFNQVDEATLNTRIIAIDMPGFGMSDKPEDYTYTNATQAEMLIKTVEALNIDSYILLGHSLGGDVAQRMAAESDRVEKLFLLSPIDPDMPMDSLSIPQFVYRLFFKNYGLQRAGFNTGPLEPLPRSIFHATLIQNHSIPSRVLQKFSEDVDDTVPKDFADQIHVPVYIAYGEFDTWAPPELLDVYLDLYPGSSGSIIEDAGHLPYLEKPKTTTALIENFINND